MDLHVVVALPTEDESSMDVDVTSFSDIDRIGARVATAARRWLRSVQVRKGVQHTTISLSACFSEPSASPRSNGAGKRRAKKAHSDAAE